MIEVIDEGVYVEESVDPYWLYEMVRGSGLTHEQAVNEVRDYCRQIGLDPYSV